MANSQNLADYANATTNAAEDPNDPNAQKKPAPGAPGNPGATLYAGGNPAATTNAAPGSLVDGSPAQTQAAATPATGWVPENHPLYGTPGFNGPASGTPGTPAATTNTTGAPSTDPKKFLQDTLMARASQSTTVDRNDPAFRAQADAYAANIERSKRDYLDDQAEKAGANATGAMDNERRLASERAGQQTGQFESKLAADELTARRGEIQAALQQMGDQQDSAEGRALQKQLAEMDAAIRREGLASSDSLGHADLDLRGRQGDQDANIRMMQLLLNNRQFGQQLGFNIGSTEAGLNRDALSTVWQ